MGLARRFLNLIVVNHIPGIRSMGIRSLRCIDLARHHFFDPSPLATIGASSESAGAQDPAATRNGDANVLMMELPDPTFNFTAPADSDRWNLDCFPLADRRVICADQAGRTFLFDADTRQLVTMPSLHKPKRMPFSIFVPSTDKDADHDDGGKLYVMEKNPRSEACCRVQHSDQFEAFVYHKPTGTSFFKSWYCYSLPPPPFVRDHPYGQRCSGITSYTVVGDGILISAEGAGTYCLNTVSNIWSQVGDWTLPFCGKVEYVPELKLWFGLSAEKQQLAAVDLSAMDSQPQLVGSWKELEPHWEWLESEDSQLVNLGSGKFCIARFWETMDLGGYFGKELIDQNFVVLTGVEVKPGVNDGNCSGSRNSKVELEVTTHKSRCLISNGTLVDAVF